MAKDRAQDPKRQANFDWDKVPSWNGPGSWESTQSVSEDWAKIRDSKKNTTNSTNARGD